MSYINFSFHPDNSRIGRDSDPPNPSIVAEVGKEIPVYDHKGRQIGRGIITDLRCDYNRVIRPGAFEFEVRMDVRFDDAELREHPLHVSHLAGLSIAPGEAYSLADPEVIRIAGEAIWDEIKKWPTTPTTPPLAGQGVSTVWGVTGQDLARAAFRAVEEAKGNPTPLTDPATREPNAVQYRPLWVNAKARLITDQRPPLVEHPQPAGLVDWAWSAPPGAWFYSVTDLLAEEVALPPTTQDMESLVELIYGAMPGDAEGWGVIRCEVAIAEGLLTGGYTVPQPSWAGHGYDRQRGGLADRNPLTSAAAQWREYVRAQAVEAAEKQWRKHTPKHMSMDHDAACERATRLAVNTALDVMGMQPATAADIEQDSVKRALAQTTVRQIWDPLLVQDLKKTLGLPPDSVLGSMPLPQQAYDDANLARQANAIPEDVVEGVKEVYLEQAAAYIENPTVDGLRWMLRKVIAAVDQQRKLKARAELRKTFGEAMTQGRVHIPRHLPGDPPPTTTEEDPAMPDTLHDEERTARQSTDQSGEPEGPR